MKTKALTLLAYLLFYLTNVLAQEDAALRQWQAGETVSTEAVESYGMAQCFVATEIPDNIWERMQGLTYKDNPHIKRKDLRYLKLLHWDYDQQIHLGEMVCNVIIAHELVEIFRQLYQARYPIQRMVLPENYGANDEQQMRANNTSCFCYRTISGTKQLSKHARGLAVDLNTLYNPYVIPHKSGHTEIQPATATQYSNRSKTFRYKINHNDLAYKLFTLYGYKWGGDWRSRKDYQHFEKDETKMSKRVVTGN